MGLNLTDDDRIPTEMESLKRIEKDAPLAIAYLERFKATDVAKALGLGDYV